MAVQKILISTDFSADALHAAEYGYNLAKQIKADLLLCNAILIPAEVPQTGMAVWTAGEYDEQIKDSASELALLKAYLKGSSAFNPIDGNVADLNDINTGNSNENVDYAGPDISFKNEAGILTDVVNGMIAEDHVDLVVIGTHRNGGIGQFLLGNHTRNMIDGIIKPLLVIPKAAAIKIPKKMAFATDFKNPEEDLATLYALIPFARSLQAEILLTHICSEEADTPALKHLIDEFMVDLSNKADYPNIYYRKVTHDQTAKGLDWLCEHGEIDILVMVHRSRNFFENLFKGSHTQKMAGRISIPLLVLSGGDSN